VQVRQRWRNAETPDHGVHCVACVSQARAGVGLGFFVIVRVRPVVPAGICAVTSFVYVCVCACVCARARAYVRFLPQHCYLGRRQTRNRWAITWTELTDVCPLRGEWCAPLPPIV
jgi:hypothetical protein